jgi:hypothetical protein
MLNVLIAFARHHDKEHSRQPRRDFTPRWREIARLPASRSRKKPDGIGASSSSRRWALTSVKASHCALLQASDRQQTLREGGS